MSSFTSIVLNEYNVNLVKSLLEWVQYTEWVNIKLCETKRRDKQEIWHHKCKISLDRKKDRKEGLYYGSTSDKEYTIRSTLNT